MRWTRSVSLADALADAELAVVAAPVTDLPVLVEEVLACAPEGCTVTDVGSTKDWSLRFPERFVGGHPVCGREARGPAHATADLFDGATWFLTPVTGTDPERYRLVHGFVAALGALPVAIDPEAHDRLVALTSHLPHALANLLVNQAGAGRIEGHEPLAAAGGSLRDMTRVAGANPRIWVDIFLDNGPELAEALAEHRRRVEQLEEALAAGDAGFLARWIAEASENRRRMLADAYADPGALQRVRVHVPDRPGRARRDHPGARRGADQHRGLRAPARLARARRRADAARHRRGRGRAGGGAARGAGLRRHDLARNRMRIEPALSLQGGIAVPGDKSISHRAVLVGAIADGESRIGGFGRSGDTESTLAAVRALGVEVEEDGRRPARARRGPARAARAGGADRLRQRGHARAPARGDPRRPAGPLRADRRRVARSRPMERIAEPLAAMGARSRPTDGRLPLGIDARPLHAIRYELPVASAQVKSCVLLAGLYAEGGPTTVVEPVPTRDHTERMLRAAGARVQGSPGLGRGLAGGAARPAAPEVPGDFSSAAPFLVAATLLPGSRLRLSGVGVNPTRIGLLDVLERMGARISIFNRRTAGGEPVADLEVAHAELVATEIEPEEVPR